VGGLRHSELASIIAEQVVDVADLCALLEIGIEDIIERFPDALEEHQGKFQLPETFEGVYSDNDDFDEDEDSIYGE
jgi:hypothetical protein